MKTIVIKYGGAVMYAAPIAQSLMRDIVALHSSGTRVVIVHGGGPDISHMCEQMGVLPTFINGLRVTDDQTLAIVQMVLAGKVNKELVTELKRVKGKAVGLSGQDGDLLVCKPKGKELGYVGCISAVNPLVLETLMQAGFLPVVAPLAHSEEGVTFNINADSAASAIAIALQADHLIFLTDVPGILTDPKDPSTRKDTLDRQEIFDLIEKGIITGGMIPKAEGAMEALQAGVGQVHILDGKEKDILRRFLQ